MLPFPVILLLACSQQAKQADTGAADGPDAADDCSETAEGVLELAPGMPDTQIHPDAVFAGGQVWLAYNVPDETGAFDVYLQSVRCDGTTGFGPERIDTPAGHNETYPRLAVNGESILLAWQTDSGQTPYNLSVSWMLFDTEGAVLSEAQRWSPDLGDGPVEGNTWMPSVTPLPGGGFALGGSIGLRSNGFSVVVQLLSQNGEPGDAIEAGPVEEGSQYESTLGTDGQGRIWIAWKESLELDTVRQAVLSTDGGLQIEQAAGGTGDEAVQGGPSYSTDWGDPPVLAYHQANSSYDIYAADQLVENPGTDHLPHVVRGGSGSLVAWFHVQSGIENDLVLATVGGDGALSEPWILASSPPAAPYRAAVAHTGGDVYFVAWSEGTSPAFRLAGQFVGREPAD